MFFKKLFSFKKDYTKLIQSDELKRKEQKSFTAHYKDLALAPAS